MLRRFLLCIEVNLVVSEGTKILCEETACKLIGF